LVSGAPLKGRWADSDKTMAKNKTAERIRISVSFRRQN